MHAVGDVRHRDLDLGPARIERLEDAAAHLSVQAADAVHSTAAADGEVGHVEGLVRVAGALAAERQKVGEPDAEAFLGVGAEVARHELRREAVEAGRDRGVRGEEVAGAGDLQRDVERLPGLVHEGGGPFQDREGGVPFVQVTDLGHLAERPEEQPAADAEEDLLAEPELHAAAVELAGDAADGRRVRRVVAVEEIERDAADQRLPGAQPHRLAGEPDLEPQDLAAGGPNRRDGEKVRIVVGIERLLAAIGGDHLAEVALLVEEAHADDGDAEVAGRLELVARDVAEAARVDRQRFGEPELHAEVGHALERRPRVRLRPPADRAESFIQTIARVKEPPAKIRRRQEGAQPGRRRALDYDPGVRGQRPQLGVDLRPELVGAVIPRRAKVERELGEDFETFVLFFHELLNWLAKRLPDAERSPTVTMAAGTRYAMVTQNHMSAPARP